MRISTKGRFAVTAMLDLALRDNRGPVALAAISARQHISLSYLEQLFAMLRRHELVDSTRGPGGGYTLRRSPDDITVADIIVAVDGHHGRDEEAERAEVSRSSSRYLINDFWSEVNAKLLSYLSSISLSALRDQQIAAGVAVEEAPTRRSLTAQPAPGPVAVSAPNSVFAWGSNPSSRDNHRR